MTETRWERGRVVLQEDLAFSHLLVVRPVRVIEDTPERLVLYSHAGSTILNGTVPNRYTVPMDERIRRIYEPGPRPLVEYQGRSHVLTFNWPGLHRSIWHFWRPDWTEHGWYVNLQLPYQRSSQGIVLPRDFLLDIFIDPNGKWSWKDRDEFAAACEAGHITAPERARIEAEAQVALWQLERREPPFSEPWPTWRPDPAWKTPHVRFDSERQPKLILAD